jgi:hypothetical protein
MSRIESATSIFRGYAAALEDCNGAVSIARPRSLQDIRFDEL